MSDEYTTGSYWMEMLKAHNWMPWKRQMMAVLRDLGLEKYIAKDRCDEKWAEGDAKVQTRIELTISDAEMIHISGAMTAQEMWDQLTMVKESNSRLGVLAT
ncbi:uncharacterized protein LACBIDRAFT_314635 [Laccaria bicolor S238N-H82]|uniref:Predicted protein n=1 Tax=Laccaria bicolor (strain S238N-H82 / ATCC MYA-4686) TaxID=486041 RepID=B0DYX7_LACBS|nr:uncharacterized protein LACBIDRAFT_314635 [Laccaria bicolor S238N-H82]EDR00222.1 predicted protein [Laccaria bicolor S238N-H82]|eukprot:XP_001889131.1 predicted protein [Laccaria bicolor S238N-H82]